MARSRAENERIIREAVSSGTVKPPKRGMNLSGMSDRQLNRYAGQARTFQDEGRKDLDWKALRGHLDTAEHGIHHNRAPKTEKGKIRRPESWDTNTDPKWIKEAIEKTGARGTDRLRIAIKGKQSKDGVGWEGHGVSAPRDQVLRLLDEYTREDGTLDAEGFANDLMGVEGLDHVSRFEWARS